MYSSTDRSVPDTTPLQHGACCEHLACALGPGCLCMVQPTQQHSLVLVWQVEVHNGVITKVEVAAGALRVGFLLWR